MTLRKKNIFSVLAASIAALLVFAVSASAGISFFAEWDGIVMCIVLTAIAIPLHLMAKKHNILYFLSFVFNSAACGFGVSAYYISQAEKPMLGTLFAAVLPSALILALCALILSRKRIEPISLTKGKGSLTVGIFIALSIAAAALSVYGWISYGSAFASFSFFSLVITVFYLSAMTPKEGKNVMRDVSFMSFTAFIIVIIIVVLILCFLGEDAPDLDVLDILDLGGDAGGTADAAKKKNKKNDII